MSGIRWYTGPSAVAGTCGSPASARPATQTQTSANLRVRVHVRVTASGRYPASRPRLAHDSRGRHKRGVLGAFALQHQPLRRVLEVGDDREAGQIPVHAARPVGQSSSDRPSPRDRSSGPGAPTSTHGATRATHRVPGSARGVPGSARRVRSSVHGVQRSAHGVRSLAQGAWRSADALRSPGRQVRSPAHGRREATGRAYSTSSEPSLTPSNSQVDR